MALSCGSPRLGVTQRASRMEPGLSSPRPREKRSPGLLDTRILPLFVRLLLRLLLVQRQVRKLIRALVLLSRDVSHLHAVELRHQLVDPEEEMDAAARSSSCSGPGVGARSAPSPSASRHHRHRVLAPPRGRRAQPGTPLRCWWRGPVPARSPRPRACFRRRRRRRWTPGRGCRARRRPSTPSSVGSNQARGARCVSSSLQVMRSRPSRISSCFSSNGRSLHSSRSLRRFFSMC